ncbi:endonuclease/exonuclease/phosphatase [Purpureocillium lavendulum]|uniref:Endonuclease/exonuclease/phosphatase n=1 Tax=Purpureocillium lavendulum TaxID=1247861 RepID=A0AB34FBI8_9HYPO|nr:endonuclease/exonuclease/phosphatase [Purpureocillium lavendulum]
MHEFNPRSVFEALYKEHCIRVAEAARTDDEIRELLPADFVSLVEEHMVEQFEELRGLGSAVAAHPRTIMDHSEANESGIKFGITLTSVGDTKAYIATNYNGVGEDRASAVTEKLESGVNSFDLTSSFKAPRQHSTT